MVIKANNHAAARSQWYDWRLQWVEQLYAIANQGFEELEQVRRPLCTLDRSILQPQRMLVSQRPYSIRPKTFRPSCEKSMPKSSGSLRRSRASLPRLKAAIKDT